jgi:hypothetical protein
LVAVRAILTALPTNWTANVPNRNLASFRTPLFAVNGFGRPWDPPHRLRSQLLFENLPYAASAKLALFFHVASRAGVANGFVPSTANLGAQCRPPRPEPERMIRSRSFQSTNS